MNAFYLRHLNNYSLTVDKQDISNLILSGGPGVGKTTAACNGRTDWCTYMFINGSEESGIDVLRTKIKNFASTVSLDGGA